MTLPEPKWWWSQRRVREMKDLLDTHDAEIRRVQADALTRETLMFFEGIRTGMRMAADELETTARRNASSIQRSVLVLLAQKWRGPDDRAEEKRGSE